MGYIHFFRILLLVSTLLLPFLAANESDDSAYYDYEYDEYYDEGSASNLDLHESQAVLEASSSIRKTSVTDQVENWKTSQQILQKNPMLASTGVRESQDDVTSTAKSKGRGFLKPTQRYLQNAAPKIPKSLISENMITRGVIFNLCQQFGILMEDDELIRNVTYYMEKYNDSMIIYGPDCRQMLCGACKAIVEEFSKYIIFSTACSRICLHQLNALNFYIATHEREWMDEAVKSLSAFPRFLIVPVFTSIVATIIYCLLNGIKAVPHFLISFMRVTVRSDYYTAIFWSLTPSYLKMNISILVIPPFFPIIGEEVHRAIGDPTVEYIDRLLIGFCRRGNIFMKYGDLTRSILCEPMMNVRMTKTLHLCPIHRCNEAQ